MQPPSNPIRPTPLTPGPQPKEEASDAALKEALQHSVDEALQQIADTAFDEQEEHGVPLEKRAVTLEPDLTPRQDEQASLTDTDQAKQADKNPVITQTLRQRLARACTSLFNFTSRKTVHTQAAAPPTPVVSPLETSKGLGRHRSHSDVKAAAAAKGVILAVKVEQKQIKVKHTFSKSLERFGGILFKAFNQRIQTALRSQEHMSETGGLTFYQLKKFRDLLKENGQLQNSDVLQKALKEIDNVSGCTLRFVKAKICKFFGAEKRLFSSWNASQAKKLQKLAPGEALLYDASTGKGKHAMMMRIEKQQNGNYKIYYSNTGAGIENKEFHEFKKVGNLTLYPTVFSIENIPAAALEKGRFFEYFAMAADLGKLHPDIKKRIQQPAQAGSGETFDHGEDAGTIANMYVVLKDFIRENKLQLTIHTDDYTIPQYGASCVPSSIWRILATIKTEHGEVLNIQILKFLDAVDAMEERYRDIKSGRDTSGTAKLLLLDQIQFLKKECKAVNLPGYATRLAEIEKKIGIANVEVPVIFKGKQPPIIQKEDKFFIQVLEPQMKRKGDHLKAEMTYKPITEKDEKGIEKNIEGMEMEVMREGDHWKGTDFLGNVHLLADAVARGESKEVVYYLDLVTSDPLFKINEMKLELDRISAELTSLWNEAIEPGKDVKAIKEKIVEAENKQTALLSEISKAEKKAKRLGQKTNLNDLIYNIYRVAYGIHQVDPTRNGRAKAKFLNDLAIYLYEITENKDSGTSKALIEFSKNFDESYYNMQVESYFDKDHPNPWVDAIKKLHCYEKASSSQTPPAASPLATIVKSLS